MVRERIKRADSSLWPWIAAGIILSFALGIGAYTFFREAAPPQQPAPGRETFSLETSVSGPRVSMKLYFLSKDGESLVAEDREVRQSQDMNEMVRNVLDELLRGPQTDLVPSLPAGARVKAVFIDGKGTAYVSFSRELQSEFPGGAWTETLAIYSIVNTLAADFPDEIKAVQILIEGNEIPTLAGHIDTSRPFMPNYALNKS
jgi:spore germination protein GerM